MGRWQAQGSNGDAEPVPERCAGRGPSPSQEGEGRRSCPRRPERGSEAERVGCSPEEAGGRGRGRRLASPPREGQSWSWDARLAPRPRACGEPARRAHIPARGRHAAGAQPMLVRWVRDEQGHTSLHCSSRVCFLQTEGKTSTGEWMRTRLPAVVWHRARPRQGCPHGKADTAVARVTQARATQGSSRASLSPPLFFFFQ